MRCNNDHNYWSMMAPTVATMAIVAMVAICAMPDLANGSHGELTNYAPLTACQHLRHAETRRAKSLSLEPKSARSIAGVRVPKCARSGAFEPVQCSNEINGTECWCVDEYGLEIPGTRADDAQQMQCPANGESPDCPASSCRMYCPAGFARDARSGCPKCACRDPCEGVQCPGDLLCQLQEVTCLTDPCPPIPTCKKARSLSDLCPAGHPLTIEDTPRPFLCGHEAGKPMCPPTYKCLVQSGNDYGVCCPSSVALPFGKPGTCPRSDDVLTTASAGNLCGSPCDGDMECPQMEKCCQTKGCGTNCRQPVNVTTCHQARMLSEIQSVNEREGRGYVPKCDERSGVFAQRQCSRNGLVCWCVDPHTGDKIRESMGAASMVTCERATEKSTGRSQSRSVDAAQKCDKNICAAVCEYGFKIDHDGCATCQCSEPCEGFQCPLGSHCEVSRDLECTLSSALCSSEPVCKPDLVYTNPCEVGAPMASNTTAEVFYCRLGETEPKDHKPKSFFDADAAEFSSSRAMTNIIECPSDFTCTKLYGVQESVCCPKAPTNIMVQPEIRPQSMCEYLRDFSERMEGTEAGMVLALPTPSCHKDGSFEARICTKKTIQLTRAQQRQMLEQNNVREMRTLLQGSAQQRLQVEHNKTKREVTCVDEACSSQCEHGYKRDANGCFTCDCQEACHGTAICPLDCAEYNGFETEPDGRRSCKCAPMDYQPLKECPYMAKCRQCELGHIFDERGCNTCECQKVKYPSHNCPKLDCGANGEENFQRRDRNGCLTCSESNQTALVQSAEHCTPKRCYPCLFGYRISHEDGCETCQCRDSPKAISKPIICPAASCAMRCPFGLKYDHNGCEVCACQETEYPTRGCPTMKCQECPSSGHKRDQHGCLTCNCINEHVLERERREASAENLRLAKVEPMSEPLDVKSLIHYLRQNARSNNKEASYMAEILSRKLLSQMQVQERSAKVIDNQDFTASVQSLDRGSAKVHNRQHVLGARPTHQKLASDLVDVEVEECFCVDGFGTEIPRSRGSNVTLDSCASLRETLDCLDITCRMGCDYGFILDPDTRCPTCECRDPCDSVTCADNQECRSVEVSCEGEYCPPVPACLPRKPGQCPFLVPPGTEGATIDSCEYECRSDHHCSGSKRCCSNGCGTQCVEPQLKTACQHLQTIQLHQATELGVPPKQKYIAQCNATDGTWMRVQCGPPAGEVCWCVDATGNELVGSRTNGGIPDCDHIEKRAECEERKCSACEFGHLLNDEGCGTCQCRNPCNEISCPSDEQCQLMRVECIDEPCPRMPVCVPKRESVCSEGAPLKRNGQSMVCGPHGDADMCPSTHTCQLDVESRKGVCCAKTRDVCFESVDNGCLSENGTDTSKTWRFSPKQNRCVQMVSEKSCQSKNLFHSEASCQSVCPVLSQCERLRLRNSLAAKRVQQSSAWFQPRCDPDTGSWSPVQCLGKSTPTPAAYTASESTNGLSRAFTVNEPTPINNPATVGVCWCADKKGAPLKGSLTRGVEPQCNHRQARRRMSVDAVDSIRDPMIEQLISQITLIADEDNLIETEFAEPRSFDEASSTISATKRIDELDSETFISEPIRQSSTALITSNSRCHALKQTASFQVACNQDGSFEPTQCNDAVCWCVDAAGNQLPNSQTFSVGSIKCIFTQVDAVSVELHFANPKKIHFKNLYDILRAELEQLLGGIPDNLRVHESSDGNIYLKFDLTDEHKIDTAFALEEMAKQQMLVLARGELVPDITLSRFVHRSSTYPHPQPAVLMPESTFQMIVFVLATSSAFFVSIFVVFVMLKRGKNKMKSYNTNKTVGMGDKFLDYSSPIFVLSASDKATSEDEAERQKKP